MLAHRSACGTRRSFLLAIGNTVTIEDLSRGVGHVRLCFSAGSPKRYEQPAERNQGESARLWNGQSVYIEAVCAGKTGSSDRRRTGRGKIFGLEDVHVVSAVANLLSLKGIAERIEKCRAGGCAVIRDSPTEYAGEGKDSALTRNHIFDLQLNGDGCRVGIDVMSNSKIGHRKCAHGDICSVCAVGEAVENWSGWRIEVPDSRLAHLGARTANRFRGIDDTRGDRCPVLEISRCRRKLMAPRKQKNRSGYCENGFGASTTAIHSGADYPELKE